MPINNQPQLISKKAENPEEKHKAIPDVYQLFRMIPITNKTCVPEPISIPGIHSVHFVTINSTESSQYEDTQPQKPDRRFRTSEPVTIDSETFPGIADNFEKSEKKFGRFSKNLKSSGKLQRRKRGHPLTPDAIASTTSSISTPNLDTIKTESSSPQTSDGSETTSGTSESGGTGGTTGSSNTGTEDDTTDQPKSTGSTAATDTTGDLSTSSLTISSQSPGSTEPSSETESSGSTATKDTTGKQTPTRFTSSVWIPGLYPVSLELTSTGTKGDTTAETTPTAYSGADDSGSKGGAQEVVDQSMAHSMEVIDDGDEYAIVDSDMDQPGLVASYEDYHRHRHLDSPHVARSEMNDGPKFFNYRKDDNKGVPGKPRGPQIAHMGRKEIVLTWLAPKIEGERPAPDGYIVQMKDGQGDFKVIGKPTTTYFAIDKLTTGRTYFFKISSRGKTGNSSPLTMKYNMDDDTFEVSDDFDQNLTMKKSEESLIGISLLLNIFYTIYLKSYIFAEV